MTKFQICSDLHLDVWAHDGRDAGTGYPVVPVDPEAGLILAGDLCEARSRHYAEFLAYCDRRWPRVFVIAGNHEFYGGSIGDGYARIRAAVLPLRNTVFLDNQTTEWGGVKIYGGTGWYQHDEAGYPPKQWSDYRWISGLDSAYVDAARAEFTHELDAALPDVVVSHMLPNWGVVSRRWVGHPVNKFFVGDYPVEPESLPKLWVHGHSHDPHDDLVEATRYVRNPRGYPGERHAWDPDLVVEV